MTTNEEHTVRPLNAKRREQTPKALARLAVVGLFVGLWFVLWLLSIPMPFPFLLNLFAYMLFFLLYWRLVFLLPTVRAVELAHYGMLAVDILFYTAMVYILGSISWSGPFAYVLGLIFANTFLDLRRGLLYTTGASLAFVALILLEATGTIPHQVYLEQEPLRYADPRFVVAIAIGGGGIFYSIYLWVNWVGHQFRRERDGAGVAQEEALDARAELERANAELEERVSARTVELERANAALRESETKFRTLAETMAAAVVIVRDKHILYVNPATEAVTGYSREELLRMDFQDVIHPDSQQLVQGRSASRERGEDVAPRYELKILAKNGETRWLDIGSSSIEFEGSEALLATAFDVTDRKRAEEAARESEEKTRLVISTAYDAFIAMDARGVIMDWNAQAETTFGWSREEALGRRLSDTIIPQQFREMHELGLEHFFATGEGPVLNKRFEIAALHRDGHEFPAELAIQAVGSGDAVTFNAFVHDVTERKQAEEALRESEERYRSLYTRTPGMLHSIDASGRLVDVSDRWLEVLGYERSEVIGRRASEFLTEDSRHYAETVAIPQFVKTGNASEIAYQFVKKNGEIVDILLSAVSEHDKGGGIFRGFAILTDVTDHKRAEEALRESEEKFRLLAENIIEVFWLLDPKDYQVLYVSPAYEELWGRTCESLYEDPRSWLNDIHPEDLERVSAALEKQAETGEFDVEFRIIRSDGSIRWVWDRGFAVRDESGQVYRVVGVAADITERKRTEEVLREQARRDPLTNLLNRRAGLAAMEERLARAINLGGRFAVLSLDIDRFKAVNDTFGHEAGDQALVQLAGLLADLAGTESVVYRMGGDEFEIGLEGVSLYQGVIRAEELRASLRRSLEASSKAGGPKFTISIGVACYPQEGEGVIDLRRSADRAMYAAKAAGGDTTRAWRHLAARQAA